MHKARRHPSVAKNRPRSLNLAKKALLKVKEERGARSQAFLWRLRKEEGGGHPGLKVRIKKGGWEQKSLLAKTSVDGACGRKPTIWGDRLKSRGKGWEGGGVGRQGGGSLWGVPSAIKEKNTEMP